MTEDIKTLAENRYELVASPSLLFAHLEMRDNRVSLVVYRSIAVEADDELYSPVAEFLAAHGHRIISETRKRDVMMLRRNAIETVYELF